MITRLKVRGYQSLADVDVEFGPFTVVVGPTGSGKSSLYRAFSLLVRNARGHSYVTRGKGSAVVAADFDERGGYTVMIERGDGIGSYVVVVGDQEKRLTKLGGEVPELVQSLLRLPFTVGAGETRVPLGFASQFDRQFLLDGASPAQVARVFGELTGVDLVFRAARESNRLKLEATAALRSCREQLERVRQRARELAKVREDIAALESAESHSERSLELQGSVRTLEALVRDVHVAKVALSELDRELPPAVDLSSVDAAADRLRLFHELLADLARARRELVESQLAEEQAATEETDVTEELCRVLEEAGICPTCGQVIQKSHTDH